MDVWKPPWCLSSSSHERAGPQENALLHVFPATWKDTMDLEVRAWICRSSIFNPQEQSASISVVIEEGSLCWQPCVTPAGMLSPLSFLLTLLSRVLPPSTGETDESSAETYKVCEHWHDDRAWQSLSVDDERKINKRTCFWVRGPASGGCKGHYTSRLPGNSDRCQGPQLWRHWCGC